MGGELVAGKGTLDTLKVGDGYWKGNPGDSEDGRWLLERGPWRC